MTSERRADSAVRYMNRPGDPGAGSLLRGLALLTCLARERRELGLSELAGLSGLDKATTHRLARTLVSAGYLTQHPTTRSYSLGLHVLDLGFSFLASLDVRQLALPYMRSLTERLGATVSLSILVDREVLYIERLSAHPVQVAVDVRIGSRLPVHCTSMGKALLAALPKTECRKIVPRLRLDAWTPKTVTSVAKLDKILDEVRTSGYALNDEETALGLRSIAAALRDRFGRPVAALNVAFSAAEYTMDDLVLAAAHPVLEATEALSKHLGWPSDDRSTQQTG